MASASSTPTHPWRERLPECGPDAGFAAVRGILDQCGFTAERICARLGIDAVEKFQPIVRGRQHLRTAESALDALILLFMDGEYVERETLERLLPPGAAAAFEELGLAAADTARPELVFGVFALFPTEGLLLACDRFCAPDHSPIALLPDVVYPASIENTAMFLSALPQTPCDALLDIGTGTGVAALAGSRYAGHAWGTDIAGRSVRFAEFNRRLNGIGNATMLEGDLYQPVEGLTFDRIVTHPPYVPAAKNTMIFRDGGEDGEQIIRGIVEGLPRFLRPGGRFYSLVTAADCEGQPFEDRIRLWLGDAEREFDLVLVSHTLTLPKDLTANSILKGNTPLDELLYRKQVWERRNVQFIFYGSVLIRRHAEERAPVTVRVQKGEGFTAEHVDWLLDWQTETADPTACERLLELKPALSPYAELVVLHRVDGGRFVPGAFSLRCSQPFDTECVVEGWVARLISQCDGRTTWREHFENARRAGAIDQATTAPEFLGMLQQMVANGLLQVE